MKTKILLLFFSLFFTATQFFGQGNKIKTSSNIEASVSLTGNQIKDKNIRAQNSLPDLKSAEEYSEALMLKLSCDANSYYDEAIVIFNNSDPDEGASKFMSMYTSAPEIWSVKNGLKYSISFLGGLDSTVIVPIAVKAGVPGSYTLTASQLESFGANIEISLEDRVTGDFINLENSHAYTFPVSSAATIADRFYLHFVDVTSVSPKDLTAIPDREVAQNFKMHSTDGVIIITSIHQQSGKIAVFDINGRKIATGQVDAGANTKIDLHSNTGIYIVSVHSSKGISNTKILVR